MRKPNLTIDYTNKDYESFRSDMITTLQDKLPNYTDTSQTDAGIVLIELLAKGLDELSYYQDNNANESFPSTCQQRSSINNWCLPLNYTPVPAIPSRLKQVFTLAFAQSSPTTIPKGTVVKTAPTPSTPSIYFETEEDLVIPPFNLGNELVTNTYTYSVNCIQGRTIEYDMVGVSKGIANQSYQLNNSEVIPDTLTLLIFEGTEYTTWHKVNSFVDSKASDKVFRIEQDDYANTTVIFGDGFTSAIPASSTKPIYANYRIGGGTIGNVAPNTVTLLDNSNNYIKETFNPYPIFEMGVDREDLESIRKNLPISTRTRWGIITEQDFKDYISKSYSDRIMFSSAMKNSLDTSQIDLYFYPKLPHTFESVSLELEEDINDRMIIGGSFTLNEAVFKEITLVFSLVVKEYYSRSATEVQVINYVVNYFKLGKYPFGLELILNDLCYEVMTSVQGIKSLSVINIPSGIITPSPIEILKLIDITVDSIGGDA